MPTKVRSKKELIGHLVTILNDVKEEQENLSKKLNHVADLLKMLVVEADDDAQNDMNINEEVEYDEDDEADPEEMWVNDVVYRRGDTVELLDSKSKTWRKTNTGKLVKFCDKMAKIKTKKGNTSRKYGNFRHLECVE
jgi:hypothetical protein